MEADPNEEESGSWAELYKVDLVPKELLVKFRKEKQGLRVGFNIELYNVPVNEIQAKVVLKPLSPEQKWKFTYEPMYHDVHLLTKKIPVTNFLNLQVGISHNFKLWATGWTWKLTTCWGGDGVSRLRNKTLFGLYPGVDLRFGWKADYVLPEASGALGTGEALFNMTSGSLVASLDRVKAILTYSDGAYDFHRADDQQEQEIERRQRHGPHRLSWIKKRVHKGQ